MNKNCVIFYIIIVSIIFNTQLNAQNFNTVKIIGIYSGKETSNTLFKAISPTIYSLAYIRAQRIGGPEEGIFTQHEDNIRYTSLSKVNGIPQNKSTIKFTFLQSDKKTPIELKSFRVIINDIDGPNNEALATQCQISLKHIATAYTTNLIIDNHPPDLNVVGSIEESEGPTSKVLFEFVNVDVIEFDNYANYGYFKDFDLNYKAFRIAEPVFVECSNRAQQINELAGLKPSYFKLKDSIDFKKIDKKTLLNIKPIYFDTEKADIRKDAISELNKVAKLMDKYPKIKISLDSHTDSKAEDNYNLRLSQFRALSTKSWIISRGIDPNRIIEKGYGESMLVNKCSNGVACTEEEHQQNRRTEFVVLNPENIYD